MTESRSSVVFVKVKGLHPTWSNSQMVELLKQQSIWFSSLTDMHVLTSVIIMSCSRLAGNSLLLYRYRLTHAMTNIVFLNSE